MSKTLIAYGTRYGATAEVAQEIAKIFKEQFSLSVELIDLYQQKIKDISAYDNIVFGSGIKMGKQSYPYEIIRFYLFWPA